MAQSLKPMPHPQICEDLRTDTRLTLHSNSRIEIPRIEAQDSADTSNFYDWLFTHVDSTSMSPQSDSSPDYSNLLKIAPWRVRLRNWWLNGGRHYAFVFIFMLAQGTYFAYSFWFISTSYKYSTFRSILGHTLTVARSAANMIKFNCAFILLPMCKLTITKLRKTILNKVIAFDEAITLHKLTAWSIVFWTMMHLIGHSLNYVILENYTNGKWSIFNLLFESGPGMTGLLMCFLLGLIVLTAHPKIRNTKFEVFYYTHQLFIPFLILCFIHGSFCFIKTNTEDRCETSFQFWKYILFPGTLYFGERIYRMFRSRDVHRILKVIQHPSKVCEIQFQKGSLDVLPGQYIYINLPRLSSFEWHPFTVTSCPDEDFVSVHVRQAGDWTKALGQLLTTPKADRQLKFKHTELPNLFVDGPFGTASQEVYDYPVAVLVAGGIGVTPFASILKDIWYRFKNRSEFPAMKLQKVYFYWIAREKEAFEWFHDLLSKIEEDGMDQFIEIHSYLTQALELSEITAVVSGVEDEKDTITKLRARTHYGRPNWNQAFGKLKVTHPDSDVGVLICGPQQLSDSLYHFCNQHTGDNGVSIYFRKEVF